MKHPLLPQNEKKSLSREYRTRLGTVFCFALSVVGIIGIVALFPTFLRSYLDEKTAKTELASIARSSDQAEIANIRKNIESNSDLVKILSEDSQAVRLSSLIERIVNDRQTLKITSLSISAGANNSTVVDLRGVAPTRDNLTDFKARIESNLFNSKVDLPVSTLNKSTNVSFNLKIVINGS